jgi:hypothetical protein
MSWSALLFNFTNGGEVHGGVGIGCWRWKAAEWLDNVFVAPSPSTASEARSPFSATKLKIPKTSSPPPSPSPPSLLRHHAMCSLSSPSYLQRSDTRYGIPLHVPRIVGAKIGVRDRGDSPDVLTPSVSRVGNNLLGTVAKPIPQKREAFPPI